jgi:hypothetical protein
MLRLADSGDVGLVAIGRREGQRRGFAYVGAGESEAEDGGRISAERLRSASGADDAITWTIVPIGSERRIGLGK